MLAPRGGRVQAGLQRDDGLRRLVQLLFLQRGRQIEHALLVRLAQLRQLACVLLLDRRQQRRAQLAQRARHHLGLRQQHREAVQRHRSVELAQHLVGAATGGQRADQQPRVDGRLEQRQVAYRATQVHLVAQLEQAVFDAVPVLHELVVLRHAEVLQVAELEGRVGAALGLWGARQAGPRGV